MGGLEKADIIVMAQCARCDAGYFRDLFDRVHSSSINDDVASMSIGREDFFSITKIYMSQVSFFDQFVLLLYNFFPVIT